VSELARLKGLGPKRLQALERSGIRTLRDLVYHLPRTYLDRTRFGRVADCVAGEDAYLHVLVHEVTMLSNRMTVTVADDSGSIELIFFQGLPYLKGKFHPGLCLVVAGTVSIFKGLQIAHPEWIPVSADKQPEPQGLLPRYPLTEAMGESRVEHKLLQGWATQALEEFVFSDSLDARLKELAQLRSEQTVLKVLHRPETLEAAAQAMREIKLRELLPLFHTLEMRRRSRRLIGQTFAPDPLGTEKLLAALPFQLTGGQAQAIRNIAEALAQPGQFIGLLQGDVGSGKTIVATLGCLGVLAQGGQVAFLAPTEILARQHFRNLSQWMSVLGYACALLTGDTQSDEKESVRQALVSGELPLIVGTHALLSEGVQFRNLGLAIIDEQHRFGVKQRETLALKGAHPHVLYLSATPIPRTLAQTLYGDMDILSLPEKPPGRLPIKTRLVRTDKRRELEGFLLSETQKGNQVFWVVPRIGLSDKMLDGLAPNEEGDEKQAARGVDEVIRELTHFSKTWKVGGVHGKMAAEKRSNALATFRSGDMDVLVATTVIEVGVDIPQANLMVIEGPDRFGLAQLHQLRGRTGRGQEQAWCFLLLPQSCPEETETRLRTFSNTEDGFALAEMDLSQRGAGHLDGTVQSGFGNLHYADLVRDKELVSLVREWVGEIP
jgi:ATP-dependent DNA helicase RecG